MHFFHTFASTLDEVNISIGHTVGSAENALAFTRNAGGSEVTETGTGSNTHVRVTQIGSVQHILKSKRLAMKMIAESKNKRAKAVKKARITKSRKTGRFQSKNFGRKTKKNPENTDKQ
jgi:hypothetical protein